MYRYMYELGVVNKKWHIVRLKNNIKSIKNIW